MRCFWILYCTERQCCLLFVFVLTLQLELCKAMRHVTVPVVCVMIAAYARNNQIVASHSLLGMSCNVTLQSATKKGAFIIPVAE